MVVSCKNVAYNTPWLVCTILEFDVKLEDTMMMGAYYYQGENRQWCSKLAIKQQHPFAATPDCPCFSNTAQQQLQQHFRPAPSMSQLHAQRCRSLTLGSMLQKTQDSLQQRLLHSRTTAPGYLATLADISTISTVSTPFSK